MQKVIRTERRKRGIFGWLFLIVFWGFNALMGISMFVGVGGNAEGYAQLGSDAERAGYVAGTALGGVFLLFIWAAGALILGMLVMATRGQKVIVEEMA